MGSKKREKSTEHEVAALPMRRSVLVSLHINGEDTELAFPPHKTLLEVLREEAALTGTKHGCELGECGACAVLVDGKPILSCLSLAVDCVGKDITTVEGLASQSELHPVQAAFADHGGSQCGYCSPGFLVSAKALLDKNQNPTLDEIKEALSGNLCRCTGYGQIFAAVQDAARRMRGEEQGPVTIGGKSAPQGEITRGWTT